MNTTIDCIANVRANRVADYLTANADVLTRYGINVASSIARIRRAANGDGPAYAALDPIISLSGRVERVSDRLTGTVVSRGGRDIHTTSQVSPDGDALAEIAMNLATNIPADAELYRRCAS